MNENYSEEVKSLLEAAQQQANPGAGQQGPTGGSTGANPSDDGAVDADFHEV